MLDKFKEKKANVVTSLLKATRPVLERMGTDKALEIVVTSLKQKNPLQVEHTASVKSLLCFRFFFWFVREPEYFEWFLFNLLFFR